MKTPSNGDMGLVATIGGEGEEKGTCGVRTSAMLDIALSCIRRGWYVFPCHAPNPPKKKGKEPLYEGAYMDATLDAIQVREWWTQDAQR